MQRNPSNKLNPADKPCEFTDENGNTCPGKWRKRYLKDGETEGFCKNCNRKVLYQ
jgi:hypothetical protein